MRFFIAYNAEPLQLRFLNWVLERTDIDKNTLMEAIRNKDKSFVDGVNVFVEFQGEVKKLANKLEASANIFMDCVYEQCTNDDDSFKYVFGDDKDETRCEKHFKKALDSLYDAFKNSMEFSKEGDFVERAKAVFDGFKNKKTKLEKLVNDMDAILVDNNKNSGNFNRKDGKPLNQSEEQSWETLEENEVYSKDAWRIYRVDEYEDMRNVASKCSDWCVARADSGRGYFYNTYGPPYYLFCKGRRNPTILMHIDSHQFKGLDDQRFEADRPTSYEAIEIGREFLESMGEEIYYDDDFEVFDESNTFEDEPYLTSNDVLENATEEEMSRMVDSTDSYYIYEKILNKTTSCDTVMKILKLIEKEYDDSFSVSTFQKIVGNVKRFLEAGNGMDKVKEMLKEIFLNFNSDIIYYQILMYEENDEIYDYFMKNLGGDKKLTQVINENSTNITSLFIKRLMKMNMKDVIEKILFSRKQMDCSGMETIIENYPNDDMIDRRLDHPCSNELVFFVAKYTTSKKIIEKVANIVLERHETNMFQHNLSMLNQTEYYIWKKIDNPKIEKKLFADSHVIPKNDDMVSILMSKAQDKTDVLIALSKDYSGNIVNEYFDKHLDELVYAGKDNGDWDFFYLFAMQLKDEGRIKRLLEKTNYDFDLFMILDSKTNLDEMEKALTNVQTLTNHSTLNSLFVLLLRKNNKTFKFDEQSRRIVLTIFDKCDEHGKELIRNTVIGRPDDPSLVREIILKSKLCSPSRSIFKIPELANDKKIIEKMADTVIALNDMEGAKVIAEKCPQDVIDKMSSHFFLGTDVNNSFNLVKFTRGMMDEKQENKFLDKYLEDNRNTEHEHKNVMSLLLGVEGKQDKFDKAVLKFINLNSNAKTNIIKQLFDNENDCKYSMHKVIDYILDKGTNNNDFYRQMLNSRSADEQQVRKILEVMAKKLLMIVIESDLGRISPLANKVLMDMDKEGKLQGDDTDFDWEYIVYNANATEEELDKIGKAVEENENIEYEAINALLLHKNCSPETADSVLYAIDPNDFLDNGGSMAALMRWEGTGVLGESMETRGWDKCVKNEDDLREVANAAKNEEEFDDILSHVGDFLNNDDDDDYDEDDEDDYDQILEDIMKIIASNKNCTVEYIGKMMEHKENPSYLLMTFIKNHKEMPKNDIDYIIEHYPKEVEYFENCSKLTECENFTEDHMVLLIRKYNYIPRYHLAEFVMHPFVTEKVLLEMIDIISDDEYNMCGIMTSKNMTDAVYSKILDVCLGKKSVAKVEEECGNDEIRKRAREILDNPNTLYGPVPQLNHGNKSKEEIKKDVVTLYRKMKCGDVNDYTHFISQLYNPYALELLSHTKDQRLIQALLSNNHLPGKIAFSLLKKNMSEWNLKSAANRTEKEILIYVGCMAKESETLDKLFRYNKKNFTTNDVMKMIKWNPLLKFDILEKTCFMFTDEELLSMKKFKDRDMDWIIDYVVKSDSNQDGRNAKASIVVDRLLKASRIIRNIVFGNSNGKGEEIQ